MNKLSRFTSLEASCAANQRELIELMTHDHDIETMDLESGICSSAEDYERMLAFHAQLPKIFDIGGEAAIKTSYRSFVFAHEFVQLVGCYDFTLTFSESAIAQNCDRAFFPVLRHAIRSYLHDSPSILNVLRTFQKELVWEDDPVQEYLARSVGGLVCMMADRSMYEHYLANEASNLDDYL